MWACDDNLQKKCQLDVLYVSYFRNGIDAYVGKQAWVPYKYNIELGGVAPCALKYHQICMIITI